MANTVEKRRKVSFTKEEREILNSLFLRALIPVISVIIISSTVLFFGFHFLIRKTGFSNYGINPTSVLSSVSQFISTYIVIAIINILLIVLLSFVVLYLVLHNTVLPILRITRNVRECMDTHNKNKICVRSSDKLFIPLVDLINKLLCKMVP